MFDFNIDTDDLIKKLKSTSLPIIMYGIGLGAEKIANLCKNNDILISDIFVSDDFFRNNQFLGFKVMTYDEIIKKYKDFIILVAFATRIDEVLLEIKSLNKKHILFAPDVPVCGDDIFDYEYAKRNCEKLNKAYNMLADEKSKQVFENIVNFKITGKIDYLDIDSENDEIYKDILNISKNESYIDLGAYDGDTIKDFLYYSANSYEKIIAFEPDKRSYKKLVKYTNSYENITCLNIAVWDCFSLLEFSNDGGRNSKVQAQSSISLFANSIDNVLNGAKCSYIKFDVEGVEKQAISGADKTIKQNKPKMQIALYHRSNDIFDILFQIAEIRNDYKFYIRKTKYIPAWEINLFCI